MIQPAYHLRPNKAVDRFVLLEVIRRLEQLENLANYTYYGLGGPYLEDFRVLYELHSDIGMVSIESKERIFKRQHFHRPCSTLDLKNVGLSQFISQYEQDDDHKSIFWLDYTNLKFSNFEDFSALLSKVAERSIVKVSLRAEPTDWYDKTEGKRFAEVFRAIMLDPDDEPPWTNSSYAKLLQDMLKIVAQRALPGALPMMFLPITSFFYSDSSGMLTLTGAVCSRDDEEKFREVFEGWHCANLDWREPQVIDVPTLSTKERLRLQEKLPCDGDDEDVGRTLLNELGYELDGGEVGTIQQLEQYSQFHRYYPYFIRAVP